MNYEAAKRAAMRGETVRRCSWATGREIRINSSVWFDSYTDTHDALTNDDMAATDWVIVRKVPSPERDVFTHPRRGDVIEDKSRILEVLAVAPEGVLWRRVGGSYVYGETGAEFASRLRDGWTVKTRAPARKS